MIYAIDFGTTNSLLAGATSRGVLPPIDLDLNAEDPTIMKSVLFTSEQNKWQCGSEAIDKYSDFFTEGRLIRSVKKYLPDPGFAGTEIFGKKYRVEDLIAIFLREMRDRANQFFQQDVTSVVMGRPAVFSLDPKKHRLAEDRLREAAKLAGFSDLEFCPEPLAASFEFRSQISRPQLTLIADFGGGTSDFTILNLSPDSFKDSDVLAMGGISVAGDAFDGSIMKNFISSEFGTEVSYRLPMSSIDLTLPKHIISKLHSPADMSFLAKDDIMGLLKDAQKWSASAENQEKIERLFILIEDRLGYRLFEEIERSKRGLSEKESAVFKFAYDKINLEENIYSSDFRSSSSDLVDRITKVLDETIAQAGVKNSDIDIVCCTGGTAKIRGLNEELAKRFGQEKLQEHKRFHSVINGLADRAFQIQSN